MSDLSPHIFSPDTCPTNAAPQGGHDSLTTAFMQGGQDSLTTAFPRAGGHDSLPAAVTAEALYGNCSTLVPGQPAADSTAYRYSGGFQGFVVGLLFLYAVMVLRFRHQTADTLRAGWSTDCPNDCDLFDTGFRAVAMLCHASMWGILAVWGIKLWQGASGIIDASNDWSAALLLAAAAAVIAALRNFTITAAGAITLSGDFSQHLNMKRFAVSVCSVLFATPALLSGVLFNGPWRYLAAAAAAAAICINAANGICRTFQMFVRQKISILVWILYLCSVELIPVTVLVLTLVRCRTA